MHFLDEAPNGFMVKYKRDEKIVKMEQKKISVKANHAVHIFKCFERCKERNADSTQFIYVIWP